MIARRLREELPSVAVIDWDDCMPAVHALVGRDVRTSPDLWSPYRQLVGAVVQAVDNVPTVVFGVCTPEELNDWPEARWALLDCDDVERRRRLSARPSGEVEDAIRDADDYRRLGLRTIDTTGLTVDEAVYLLTNVLSTG